MWPVDNWKSLGYFTDEYISDINIHWLRFSPPNPSSFYILGTLYIFMMIFGVSGNFLVVYLFVRCKSLRTPANSLIVNLAVSDGLMTMKVPIFAINCFYRGPALGDKACRIYGFIGGLTGTVTIMTLSVISFDRYVVIKFPLKRSFSNMRIKICLMITWFYGILFASVPALNIGFGKYTYEGYLTSCSFDYLTDDKNIKNFIFIFFIAAWLVPFALIAFSYINILKVVMNRSSIQARGTDSFRHVKEEENKKQEVKLALIVFSTILLWFISWTPYSIVALLGIFDQKHLITPLTSMVPALFCKTASCVNAYVYALSHPKFIKEVENLCCGCSKSTREKNNKVWTTESSTRKRQQENFDADEEVLEVSVGSVKSIRNPRRPLERESTVVEMLCLRPSFRNKPSSFRKLARKWSSKERVRKQDEGEQKEEAMVF